MRWLPLLIAMMIAGSAHAASDCQAEGDVRAQAECIHDALAPDVIEKLYRLALSTVNGKIDRRNPPRDFLYIAEEAGEAARPKGPKPLFEMAKSDDTITLAFAARAITAFLAAVRDGYSHHDRFENKGDAKLSADAKPSLRAACKRLASRDEGFVRVEGQRCLHELDRTALPASFFSSPDVAEAMQTIKRDVGGGVVPPGGGGLRGTDDTLGLAAPRAAASYRDSCDKGDGKGCYFLAELNRFERFGPGRTYPQNLPRAVELYQRSCDLGFAWSCSDLAEMLRAGKGIPRDAARAAALDRRACKLNHGTSCGK